jgi:hypothetical protein
LVRGVNRFQVAFVNQRYITEGFLNEAITTIVNGLCAVPTPEALGHRPVCIRRWDEMEFIPLDLMSEYHIRYGGYGGVGYYLVADNYIALMSRWTTCGAWEGHAILDFL